MKLRILTSGVVWLATWAAVPGTYAATPAWTSSYQFSQQSGLVAASAVYDQTTNTMTVFGGIGSLGGAATSAVLLYAPATGNGSFSILIPDAAPGSPLGRVGHSAVYDSANHRMIVFGGLGLNSTTFFNDVWVLTNANGQGGAAAWIQLSPTGPLPAARDLHTAVYDAAHNEMIVFGGGQPYLTDVWVLKNANGLGGTPAWTKLSPTGGTPSGVDAGTAVYDPSNNIMTVFAGLNVGGTAGTNGVWRLLHANGRGGTPRWTNIVANGAAGSPAKREGCSAVHDAANNRMIVFGGGVFPGTRSFNDVWVLTNANGIGGTPAWTQLKPAGLPPGTRYFQTAVYDRVNNQMIIFAGNNAEAIYFVPWVLSGANGL